MTTEKTPNYTAEMEAVMREAYVAAPTEETVKALAEKLGKTTRSIVAKLSRMGVYVAKTYVTKTGEKPIKKDAHADAIGKVLKLSDGEIDSLAKANKTVLVKLWKALAESKPIEGTETAKAQAEA
ncbi:hypothetical protein UFOVP273_121 [uncultured Caudovirales phage]|uniref:Uncharacterized protein n=1 Tax=uncultured Caudovirales phage TaxID=2100421 RepID=A0A6J5LLV1_9CAUD|nr:hypothetical protein UFOVP273_121 [uncultured Caudovirales phage]